MLAPAFVDPHVHLRVPGREDEETIATGTAAAAAGGYCAILAMPNTDPVVDTAAVLGALIEQAREEAAIPTGFMASISKGLRGEELTEMAELARLGAAAFTDDGHPVASAGLMQRALPYSAVTGRILALHEEEPTLSRDGQMHEGAVSARARARRLALGGGVHHDRARLRACRHTSNGLVHIMHLSARESVAAVRAAQRRGVAVSAEVSPHHLCLTDDTVRTLDTNRKMNPPLRSEDDRAGAARGPARRHDRMRRDRSRAARATREGRALRGGTVRRHGPRDRLRSALHVLVEPGELELEVVLERMSAGPARVFGLPVRGSRRVSARILALLDLDASRRVTEDAFRSRSTNSWLLGQTLRGAIVKTIADGRVVHAA